MRSANFTISNNWEKMYFLNIFNDAFSVVWVQDLILRFKIGTEFADNLFPVCIAVTPIHCYRRVFV